MKKIFAVLMLTLSVASLAVTTDAMARRGADDPAGHVRGGHGADDPAGDDRGGHGADDPAGHQ